MIKGLESKILEASNPIGVKKPPNYNLPKEGHTYGLPGKADKEGVDIITRTWKTHRPTSSKQPAMDYIRINKMAIKMNATNFATNKDFRQTVDIRQRIPKGKKTFNIKLPPSDFAYGVPNRTPTPIKDVINGEYGNRAENHILREYGNYIQEKKNIKNHLRENPKIETKYINPKAKILKEREEEKRKFQLDYDPLDEELPKEEKENLWKMKMFQGATSKVAEGIKQFKTYHPYKKKDNIDKMIDTVQAEIAHNNNIDNQRQFGNQGEN